MGSGGNIENIPMSGTHTVNAQRFVSKLVRHGASQVSIAELVAQGQIIWAIGPDQVLSGTCIRAEEFMASAARRSRQARDIMAPVSPISWDNIALRGVQAPTRAALSGRIDTS